MTDILHAIRHALAVTGAMTWGILWALIFGFFIAAIIQSVVSRSRIAKLLPNARPRSLATATGLGIASSSCSYAAVAISRTLFRKGANFTSAIAFQLASTNLVIELGVLLWVLMAWQFTAAEYVGGILMISALAVLWHFTLRPDAVAAAREQAEKGVQGTMEGHAAMDMSLEAQGSVFKRIVSKKGWRAISDNFVMEWAATLRDIAIGLLIAGAVAAWVPDSFWQKMFFEDNEVLSKIWGPIIGPVVAIATFVCSIGNVALAAVLWNSGISFGGVISFIFADLLIIPILVIYRKYYGRAMAIKIFFSLWLVMTVSGWLVELIFGGLGLIPETTHMAMTQHTDISWNYTTILNMIALGLAAVLVFSFWKNGSWPMLSAMNGSDEHDHSHHAEHVDHSEHEHVELDAHVVSDEQTPHHHHH